MFGSINQMIAGTLSKEITKKIIIPILRTQSHIHILIHIHIHSHIHIRIHMPCQADKTKLKDKYICIT